MSESAEAASALGESAARLLDTRLSNDALVSLLVAVSPSIPGFLVQVKALNVAHVPPPLINRYNQAWFVGFAIAFVVYLFYGS